MKLNLKILFFISLSIILISSCAKEIEDAEFFPFHPLETEWPLIYSSSLYSISADNSDSLYISGFCTGYDIDLNPGIGTDQQNCTYFLSKINKTTGYEWSKTLSSQPGGIRNDSSGNTYISGSYYSSPDFDPSASTDIIASAGATSSVYVSKFNSNGDYQWTHACYGDATDNIAFYDVTVDSAGSTYITGTFTGATVNFEENGNSDPFTSNGSTDAFITKIDTSGNYQWTVTFGAGSADYGDRIATDSNNNVYLIGRFEGTVDFDPGVGTANKTAVGSYDVFIVKLNSAGVYQWVNTFGTVSPEIPESITIDSSDYIYITGRNYATLDMDPGAGTTNILGVYLARYNSSGDLSWAKEICYSSTPEATATDNSGNVYVTGSFFSTCTFGTKSYTPLGSYDGYILKYTASDGTLTGAGVYKGTESSSSVEPTMLISDSTGDVYVAGRFFNEVDFYPHIPDDDYGRYSATSTKGFFLKVDQ